MREAHRGQPSARKGATHTDEAKELLRQARMRQVSPHLVAHGITKAAEDAAKASGFRWCSGQCKAFVPGNLFYGTSKKTMACGPCTAFAQSGIRAAKTDEERAATAAYLSQYRIERSDLARRNMLKKYGVTPEWYGEKWIEQGEHCALCDTTEDNRKLPKNAVMKERGKFLAVDHNHETGKARGVLCFKCNAALHCVEYKPDWAHKALAYLAQYAPQSDSSPSRTREGVR
tara:strand:- start:4182 stop:4871 length:690 start_codon:yes stop_codon:yes gene_type:complete